MTDMKHYNVEGRWEEFRLFPLRAVVEAFSEEDGQLTTVFSPTINGTDLEGFNKFRKEFVEYIGFDAHKYAPRPGTIHLSEIIEGEYNTPVFQLDGARYKDIMIDYNSNNDVPETIRIRWTFESASQNS